MAFANGDFIGVSSKPTAVDPAKRSVTQFDADTEVSYSTIITARDNHTSNCYR